MQPLTGQPFTNQAPITLADIIQARINSGEAEDLFGVSVRPDFLVDPITPPWKEELAHSIGRKHIPIVVDPEQVDDMRFYFEKDQWDVKCLEIHLIEGKKKEDFQPVV